MDNITPDKIRNIAIIAHVDHGKTTLVDSLLKQTHVFRENEAKMQEERILDNNDLERERGITITAKNIAIFYKDHKINIIDTPGHADFGGEVERTLNMADGCLLLIDAQEGPMPQTRFVLKKALELSKKIIVVVNKIDKPFADVNKVISHTSDLFLELANNESDLEFPIYYAIAKDGKVFKELPSGDLNTVEGDVTPLLDEVLEYIPAPEVEADKPLQMLVSSLGYDLHEGRIIIGRIARGSIKAGMSIALIHEDNTTTPYKINKVYIAEGLSKKEVTEAVGGDIVSITGIKAAKIGETISDPSNLESLPKITTQDPPVRIKFEANTSPFLGKEGKFVNSRQLEERLLKEMETNISMRLEKTGSGGYYVSGRGELHLSILIETMRREGYEFQVSRPETIFKEIEGKEYEPLEEVLIDTSEEYVGVITNELSRRKGEMIDMVNEGYGNVRFVYRVLTKNLLGLRNELINNTRGKTVINNYFIDYVPKEPPVPKNRNGVIIASHTGTAMAYAIETIQDRGDLFITPATEVYEGMIVGINKFEQDMVANVCRERHKTGVRSAFVEVDTPLKPIIPVTLEFALTFIERDELLEVTPKSLRLRKRYLTQTERDVQKRKQTQ